MSGKLGASSRWIVISFRDIYVFIIFIICFMANLVVTRKTVETKLYAAPPARRRKLEQLTNTNKHFSNNNSLQRTHKTRPRQSGLQ